MENELYHHGVLGQKWGVRRYQNKDGSLTYAGKKRALKMQNQYTELSNNKKYHNKDGSLTYAGRKKSLKMKEKYSKLTGGKQLRKYSPVNNGEKSSSAGPKKKSISEMSNQEIQDKIDRIRLENTLKSLTPQQTTKGEIFVNGLKSAAIGIAKDKGTKLVGDYVDKKLRTKLGLSDKDAKSASKILQEKAQDYENRQKIDKAQRYFKEGKYAESKKTNSGAEDKSGNTQTERSSEKKQKSQSTNKQTNQKTETWYGTVEGEGASKGTHKDWKSTRNDEPIDVEWREVNNENIRSGQSFVNQLLLEDKKHR